ncbi:hypothetical protein SBA5_90002 [Candidatus Sulfotelmatomonas gaucii]|uniref:Uncharacterized protein n=1 Tax=Candidatus Sulfuritelmatomonas gaucii TaxID=2043161 RepID=A0A2N9M824_9BACT|nr:hypothetical protein SBA5_90002 [Candidatus Sulfotelmatomonas gaucii]
MTVVRIHMHPLPISYSDLPVTRL